METRNTLRNPRLRLPKHNHPPQKGPPRPRRKIKVFSFPHEQVKAKPTLNLELFISRQVQKGPVPNRFTQSKHKIPRKLRKNPKKRRRPKPPQRSHPKYQKRIHDVRI